MKQKGGVRSMTRWIAVFMVVAGWADARATLSLESDYLLWHPWIDTIIGETYTVWVTSDADEPYTAYLVLDNTRSYHTISGVQATAVAGEAATATQTGFEEWVIEVQSSVSGEVPSGHHFAVDVTCLDCCAYSYLRLLDADGTTVLDEVLFVESPEPATVMLTGIGGLLFLRRRSRT